MSLYSDFKRYYKEKDVFRFHAIRTFLLFVLLCLAAYLLWYVNNHSEEAFIQSF